MNLKKVIYSTLALSATVFIYAEDASKPSANSSWCENFDNAQANGQPAKWQSEGSKWRVPETQCTVKDGILTIKCDKSTGGIITDPQVVDLKKTPVMRWRWRVISYPNKADGRKRRRDDQPVAIYIGTDDGAVAKKSIAYRWEGLTPVGYEGKAKYGGGILTVNYIVMRNQDSKAGEWITETRNVAEDFKRIYGQIPEKFAVNVSGNSQYTKSNTVAEIDFIEFIPAPAK